MYRQVKEKAELLSVGDEVSIGCENTLREFWQLLTELMGMPKLIIFGLLAAYVYGVWKFWNGFERTNFAQSLPNRLGLSLLWPALFITNPSYRRNFKKALKG